MAGRVKFTMQFQFDPYAFRESHYLPNAANTQDLTGQNLALRCARARVNLLGLGVVLAYVEMEDEDKPGSTVLLAPQIIQMGAPAPGGLGAGNVQVKGFYQERPDVMTDPKDFALPPTISETVAITQNAGQQAVIGAQASAVPPNDTMGQPKVYPPRGGIGGGMQGGSGGQMPPPIGTPYNPDLGIEIGDEPENADFAYSDVKIRRESWAVPVVYHSTAYLAGNPDVMQIVGNQTMVDPAWIRAFNTYADLMVTGQYGQKVLNRTTGVGRRQIVLSISLDNANRFVLHMATPQTSWKAGTRLLLSGNKGSVPSLVNGPKVILSKTDDFNFVLATPLAPAGWLFGEPGTASMDNHIILPYSKWFLQGFTHRKRGNKENNLRGRKSAKRSSSVG